MADLCCCGNRVSWLPNIPRFFFSFLLFAAHTAGLLLCSFNCSPLMKARKRPAKLQLAAMWRPLEECRKQRYLFSSFPGIQDQPRSCRCSDGRAVAGRRRGFLSCGGALRFDDALTCRVLAKPVHKIKVGRSLDPGEQRLHYVEGKRCRPPVSGGDLERDPSIHPLFRIHSDPVRSHLYPAAATVTLTGTSRSSSGQQSTLTALSCS